MSMDGMVMIVQWKGILLFKIIVYQKLGMDFAIQITTLQSVAEMDVVVSILYLYIVEDGQCDGET